MRFPEWPDFHGWHGNRLVSQRHFEEVCDLAVNMVPERVIQRRMVIALFALAGLLIASYLSLFRLGLIGQLICSPGSGCSAVQLSPWSKLFGAPVPYIGVVAYTAVLVLALLGIRLEHVASVSLARGLFGLGITSLAFAAYNVIVETFVIRAYCPWCLACAGCATAIFAFSVPEARWLRAGSVDAVMVEGLVPEENAVLELSK